MISDNSYPDTESILYGVLRTHPPFAKTTYLIQGGKWDNNNEDDRFSPVEKYLQKPRRDYTSLKAISSSYIMYVLYGVLYSVAPATF